MKERITPAELAKMWGVTTRTLQLWREAKVGPRFVQISERKCWYRPEDIEAYEKANTFGGNAPWVEPVKRAAGALRVLAKQAKTDKARETLMALSDELRALI